MKDAKRQTYSIKKDISFAGIVDAQTLKASKTHNTKSDEAKLARKDFPQPQTRMGNYIDECRFGGSEEKSTG